MGDSSLESHELAGPTLGRAVELTRDMTSVQA